MNQCQALSKIMYAFEKLKTEKSSRVIFKNQTLHRDQACLRDDREIQMHCC